MPIAYCLFLLKNKKRLVSDLATPHIFRGVERNGRVILAFPRKNTRTLPKQGPLGVVANALPLHPHPLCALGAWLWGYRVSHISGKIVERTLFRTRQRTPVRRARGKSGSTPWKSQRRKWLCNDLCRIRCVLFLDSIDDAPGSCQRGRRWGRKRTALSLRTPPGPSSTPAGLACKVQSARTQWVKCHFTV